jgi:phosphotransferase system HPr (HPr) family protein
MSYHATIRVISGEREANAKSILEVMALGAEGGSEITVRAEGDDSEAALEAIQDWSAGLDQAH